MGSSATNHSSSQKTRLNVLSYGIKIWTDLSSILSQITRLPDRRTDGQTDGQTEFSSLDRVCISCSAVKTKDVITRRVFTFQCLKYAKMRLRPWLWLWEDYIVLTPSSDCATSIPGRAGRKTTAMACTLAGWKAIAIAGWSFLVNRRNTACFYALRKAFCHKTSGSPRLCPGHGWGVP